MQKVAHLHERQEHEFEGQEAASIYLDQAWAWVKLRLLMKSLHTIKDYGSLEDTELDGLYEIMKDINHNVVMACGNLDERTR